MNNATQIHPPSRHAGKLIALVAAAGLSFGIFHFWMQTLPSAQAHYLPGYAMATVADYARKKTVTVDKQSYLARPYAETLRLRVYDGHPVQNVILMPTFASGILLFGLLLLGGASDKWRMAKFRAGRRLRGPELLTVRQYNKQSEGDGLAILLEK
jgi:hypothetical protein